MDLCRIFYENNFSDRQQRVQSDQCLLLIMETLSDSFFEHWNRGRQVV